MIDVGLSFGPSAKADGLLQPYKVSDLGLDPRQRQGRRRLLVRRLLRRARLRGEQGHRQEVAARTGPTCSAHDYKNAVALAGDPRASNQAIQGVYAAGLSAAGGDVAKAPARPASNSSPSSTRRATSCR